MGTKILIVITFLLTSLTGAAQNGLMIYHATGSAYIINGKVSLKASRGIQIPRSASLQIKINSSCMVIDSLGKSVLVNKPGTYNFPTLSQMLKTAGKENVPGEFYAYIYQNFIKQKKSDAQRITAIVQRGYPLMIQPKDSVIITSDKIMLSWKRVSKRLTMQLVIRNSNAEIIVDTLIKNSTTLTINVSDSRFIAGNNYQWKVDESGTSQPSQQYYNFIIPDKADINIIRQEQKAITNKNLPSSLKWELQKDIFEFWSDKYM